MYLELSAEACLELPVTKEPCLLAWTPPLSMLSSLEARVPAQTLQQFRFNAVDARPCQLRGGGSRAGPGPVTPRPPHCFSVTSQEMLSVCFRWAALEPSSQRLPQLGPSFLGKQIEIQWVPCSWSPSPEVPRQFSQK